MRFDFTIEHVPGKLLQTADSLSRALKRVKPMRPSHGMTCMTKSSAMLMQSWWPYLRRISDWTRYAPSWGRTTHSNLSCSTYRTDGLIRPTPERTTTYHTAKVKARCLEKSTWWASRSDQDAHECCLLRLVAGNLPRYHDGCAKLCHVREISQRTYRAIERHWFSR